MMIHATFDASGLPTGFWPEDIYPVAADGSANLAVPAGAVEITEADWDALRAAPGSACWSGGKVAPYAPPVDLKAYAATARYAKETAGITVGTAPIATDRVSQALITGMWAATQMNPAILVSFKSPAGFVTVNATQIQAIAAAVVAHVQGCFTTEGQVDAAITAGTVTTTTQVDAAFAAVTS